MKKVIFYLLALLMAGAFQACVKEDDEDQTQYTIQGYLYKNCDQLPYANLALNFVSVRQRNFEPAERQNIGSTTTNNEGYFSFTYNSCSSAGYIEVNDANEVEVFSTICGLNNSNIWYNSPKSSHYLKIITDSSFSANDTLVVGAETHFEPVLTKEGPFSNNQLILIDSIRLNAFPEGYVGFAKNLPTPDEFYLWWGLGKQDAKENLGNGVLNNPYVVPYLKQSVCGVGDTVVIDLRGYQ